MEHTYDIAIVGSGLGGLICANILSRNGFSVILLEKNASIGGCLQDFSREKCHFDTGIHYIGSYDEGQNLRKIFDYLQISDLIEVEKLSDDAFDKINIKGKEYKLAQGVERFREQLIAYFPEEKKAINTYVAKMLEIIESVNLLNLRPVEQGEINLYDGLGISAYDYICSVTNNQALIDVLSSLNVLSNNQKTTATLHYHMLISHFYIQSAYKVLGGGRSIARSLFKVAKKNNTKLLLNAEVCKVNMEEKLISSIELRDGREISAKHFISDIDPNSFMTMLPPKALRKSYLRRVERFKNSIPVFSLYLVMKEKQFKYINSNYYYFKESDSIWRTDKINMKKWPLGFIMFSTESKQHKGYAESVIIMSQIEFEEFKKWENTKVENRGEDYLAKKAEYSEMLLQQVEEVFPDFAQCVKSQYSSTPLTYRDYTGVPKGGMYGTIKDFNNPLASLLHTVTAIKNLVLTGQSVNLHGVLGVALTALLSCGSFLNINDLIKEINEEKI